MICPHLKQDRWQYCTKLNAYTASLFCALCQEKGEEYIKDIFDRRDGKKPNKTPRPIASTPQMGLVSKGLKAGSQAIGRVAGKEKVSAEELAEREKICRKCELLRIDEVGDWCGELLQLRFGKDAKEKKGCGCLLDEKRQYKNFQCPRKLW